MTTFTVTLSDTIATQDGLAALEARYYEHVHQLSKYNQSRTARALGVSRGTLRTKLKTYFGDKYV